MKKLMFMALGAALVGSASAVTVYDYKASVKHPYLKQVTVRNAAGTANIQVYAKYLKTTSLRGYLIQDDEAVLNGGHAAAGVGAATITGPVTVAQPENRCFLVAINNGAGAYKYPRIIPGIIEAKWYNPTMRAANSVQAQGYLFLGGEFINPAVADLSVGGVIPPTVWTDGSATPYQVYGHKNAAIAITGVAIAAEAGTATYPVAAGSYGVKLSDYAFVSEYLFGQFNSKAGNAAQFADTWMNGAGFGKAGAWNAGGVCCGWDDRTGGIALQSLQGNLKGGLYLCSDNGDDAAHSRPFGFNANAKSFFEKQLWAAVEAMAADATAVPVFAAVAANYNDLWTDGMIQLDTTDCASGTWSIKLNTRDLSVALDPAGEESEIATLASMGATVPAMIGVVPTADRAGSPADSADGTVELLETIKGCMKALDRNAQMIGTDLAAAPNGAKAPTALFGPTFYNAYLAQ